MKVCGGCGEQYNHFVDFCFSDGEILVPLDATASPETGTARGNLQSLSRDLPSGASRWGPLEATPPSEPRFIVLPEPPPDRSSLRMAGVALAFMVLLVPLIGGLILGSMQNGEHEAASADPPAVGH